MKRNIKGVALLWVLILSSILLIISGTMVGYITKEAKSTISIEDSNMAYAAARSGVEWALNYIEKNPGITTMNKDLYTNPPVYSSVYIEKRMPPLTPKPTFYILSKGFSGDVKRVLEYNKVNADKTEIAITGNNVQITPANAESFTMRFNFWLDAANKNSSWNFGLQSPDTLNKIYLNYNNGNVNLEVSDDGNIYQSQTQTLRATYAGTNPYDYIAEIQYIKDTAAILTIYENDLSVGPTATPYCVYSKEVTISLVGKLLGDLKNSYGYNGITPINTPATGDILGIPVSSPSPNPYAAYIDIVTLSN